MGGTAGRPRWGSFPTTADVGIWARALSPAGLFEGLGLALFAQMTDLRRVRPRESRTVSVHATDPPALVVAYLTQLLDLQQVDGFLARRITVHLVGTPPTSLIAEAWGEPFDPARHAQRIEVKAVTFHRLVYDPVKGRARVILDI